MSKNKNIFQKKSSFLRKTKNLFDKHPVIKFLTIAAIILVYFIFVSRSHGLKDGLLISLLTWSFFVLCTPIADAGILIDFPIRLVSGIKMVYSEIIVWVVAMILNLFVFLINPPIYDKTILLSLFKHILGEPFPYWSIILLSGVGTFLSIYIMDNIVDSKRKTKKHLGFLAKHKTVLFVFTIILVLTVYDFLLNKLGVEIPLL